MTEYNDDRAAWAEEQGRWIRQRRSDRIDYLNAAAEIERLGADDVALLRERIRILLTAMLRWAYQVDLRSVALSSTILAQRSEIERVLKDSGSLRPITEELAVELYPAAKTAAVLESGLFDESFPEALPFTPSEVFDLTFLPDPFGDDQIRGQGWWRKS